MLYNTLPAEVWVPMAAGCPLSLGCTTGSAWDSAFSSACFWAGGCRQSRATMSQQHQQCWARLRDVAATRELFSSRTVLPCLQAT